MWTSIPVVTPEPLTCLYNWQYWGACLPSWSGSHWQRVPFCSVCREASSLRPPKTKLETMGSRSSAAGDHNEHGESVFGMMGLGCAKLPRDLVIRHQRSGRDRKQLISPLAWVPLRGHLPEIFCLVNSGKIVPKVSTTDLWQHPAPTFFPNGLSLSPLLLFTQVLQAGFCDCENISKQLGIL